MAFWDQVASTVSKGSKTVAEKTKQIATITKLHSSINTEEEKIKALYMKIGREYYESHKNDDTNRFANELKEINQGFVKIQHYKQQIRDIKGVYHCANCGADVDSNDAFCGKCGFHNKHQESETNNNANESYTNQTYDSDIVSEEVITPIKEQKEDGYHYCSVCHEKLPDDASFCGNCGAPQ